MAKSKDEAVYGKRKNIYCNQTTWPGHGHIHKRELSARQHRHHETHFEANKINVDTSNIGAAAD